jgi:transposase InsO family protein
MTHVRTSPYYPLSGGKIECWHQTLKVDGFRPGQADSPEQARALVARFAEHYVTIRLHSALGDITPADFLAGRGPAIWAERDRKLEAARELRRQRRAAARPEAA